MSLRLQVRERPQRSIALRTDTHALEFRNTPSTSSVTAGGGSSGTSALKCMVKFSPLDNTDIDQYDNVRSIDVHGTLGLINIAEDIFLCVISGSVRVATVRPYETIQRITSVDFCQYISMMTMTRCY